MPDDATKRCTKCGEVKPLSEFSRAPRNRDGLHCWCRACKNADRRARREADPEKARRQDREKSKRYSERHPEAERERSRQWKVANRAVVLEYSRQYYAATADAQREYARKRNAEIRATVLAHYGKQCACCGTTADLSIDHIGGGGNAHRREILGQRQSGNPFYLWLIREGLPPGYQTLCMPCNRSKGRTERCHIDHS